MRRTCSFPGCQTGSAGDRRRNKQSGTRNRAMFSFPPNDKKPVIRQKWEEILGRKAADNEVLCELHFRPEDILKSYEVLLTNGIKHTMDRGKIDLRLNAIPDNKIWNEDIIYDNNMDVEFPEETKEKNAEEDVLEFEESKPDLVRVFINELDGDIKFNTESDSSPQSDQFALTFKSESEDVVGEVSNEPRLSPLPIPENAFSLQNLYRDLGGVQLPKGWHYVLIKESEAILVAHWRTNRPADKEFVINADGSVQVYIQKRCLVMPGVAAIKTTNDVINNIKILQKMLLCDGTAVILRHLNSCEGYVLPPQTSVKYGHVRCSSCKKYNAQTSRQERRELRKADRQYLDIVRMRQIAKNEKAKNKRMKVTVDALKNEMQRLIKQIYDIKKNHETRKEIQLRIEGS